MTEDTYDIIHSPLARLLSGEGHTLEIAIYRGADEPDWILEIEDETGTSTVFDERFATDQEALDTALAEIEAEGGIHSFYAKAQAGAMVSEAEMFAKLEAMKKSPPMASATTPHSMMAPLSLEELDELDGLLLEVDADQGMTLDTLDGFLHAIAIGPETVMPSQWMPKVWGLDDGGMMPPMDSLKQVNHLLGLVMRHYNSIISYLEQSPLLFAPVWPTYGYSTSDQDDAEGWANGFTDGVKLNLAAWQPLLRDPQGQQWYRPIELLGDEDAPPEWDDLIRTSEQRAALTAQIEHSVRQMRAYWLPLRQAVAERQTAQFMSAKVGRNEPCPCGSGKKFKKCCGSPVDLH
jgi:uncharacterized protein